jgi:Protein of unknown function (DUF2911)
MSFNTQQRAREMFHSLIRVAALIALGAGSLSAQQSPPPMSGAFVTRLGTDTVAVEQYSRTSDKLVGDLLLRNPRTRVFHYVADLTPNGMIKGMTVSIRRVGSDSTTPPMTMITTLLADSVATIDVARSGIPDTAVSGKKIYHGLVVPQIQTLPSSYAIYEQILSTSRLRGSDSVGYVLMAPGRNPSPSIWLSRRGRDSVAYNNTVFPGWIEVARVDGQGRVLGVNSTATTVKTIATRVDRLDFDAIAKAWASSEASRGPAGQMSPPDTVRSTIGAAKIEVAYSRPLKRGRVIFGNVVPYGQVWRTGANAATQFTTSSDLMFGSTVVPAGKYTLWSLPTATGAKLIINSQTGQWGTDYDPSKDFARLDLATKSLAAPVDHFTIVVVPQGSGGLLRFSWDTTEYSIPFTVK